MGATKDRNENNLTPRQQAFVDRFLIHQNAAQAMRDMGYEGPRPDKAGFQMKTHPIVSKVIKERLAAMSKRLSLDAEKVLTDIARVAQKAEDEGEYSASLKGHELLGKHLKLFTDKTEVTGKDGEMPTMRLIVEFVGHQAP